MNSDPANPKVLNVTITVAVAAIVVVAVIATIVLSSKNGSQSTTAQMASTAKTTKTSPPATTAPATYKDGTYTAKGSYNSPGGEETITVTLTLASNVITDSTVVGNGDPGISGTYQAMFINGYKAKVVGKKISSVHLSHVSGSSLTSIGFNLALKSIENQAS